MGQQFDRQLKKGALEMLVLKMLSRDRMYGYRLIQELSESSNGFFSLKQGTLYPILYRLEESGFAVSKWEEPETGKTPKKYYEITDEGKAALMEQMDIWQKFTDSVNQIMVE